MERAGALWSKRSAGFTSFSAVTLLFSTVVVFKLFPPYMTHVFCTKWNVGSNGHENTMFQTSQLKDELISFWWSNVKGSCDPFSLMQCVSCIWHKHLLRSMDELVFSVFHCFSFSFFLSLVMCCCGPLVVNQEGQPLIEGKLKEKQVRWKFIKRWKTRYFTLAGNQLLFRRGKSVCSHWKWSLLTHKHTQALIPRHTLTG